MPRHRADADRIWTRGRPRRNARARSEVLGGMRRALFWQWILGSSWPSRIYFPDRPPAGDSQGSRDPRPTAPRCSRCCSAGPDETNLADEVMRQLDDLPARSILQDRTSLARSDRDLSRMRRRVRTPIRARAYRRRRGMSGDIAVGATAAERSARGALPNMAISGAIPCHPCLSFVNARSGESACRRISEEVKPDHKERARDESSRSGA